MDLTTLNSGFGLRSYNGRCLTASLLKMDQRKLCRSNSHHFTGLHEPVPAETEGRPTTKIGLDAAGAAQVLPQIR